MKEYIRTDNLKNQYYGKKKKKIIRKKKYIMTVTNEKITPPLQ